MTIKLSELPVYTLIEAENGEDKYLKTQKHIWQEVDSRFNDGDGTPLDERDGVKIEEPFVSYNRTYIEVTKTLEEYFGNYTIISLPMPVIHTAIWLGDKLHNPSAKTVVEDAIKYELVTERDNDEEL